MSGQWFSLLVLIATTCLCNTTDVTQEYEVEFGRRVSDPLTQFHSKRRVSHVNDPLTQFQDRRRSSQVDGRQSNVGPQVPGLAIRAKAEFFEFVLNKFLSEGQTLQSFMSQQLDWPPEIITDPLRPTYSLTDISLARREENDDRGRIQVELLPGKEGCNDSVRLTVSGLNTHLQGTLKEVRDGINDRTDVLLIIRDMTLIIEANPDNFPNRDMNVKCEVTAESNPQVDVAMVNASTPCAFVFRDTPPRDVLISHVCHKLDGQTCCKPWYDGLPAWRRGKNYELLSSIMRQKIFCEPIKKFGKLWVLPAGPMSIPGVAGGDGYDLSLTKPIDVTEQIVEVMLKGSTMNPVGPADDPWLQSRRSRPVPIPQLSPADDAKMLNLYMTDFSVNAGIQVLFKLNQGFSVHGSFIVANVVPELGTALSLTCPSDEVCLGKVFPAAASERNSDVESIGMITVTRPPYVRFTSCDVRLLGQAVIRLNVDKDVVDVNVSVEVAIVPRFADRKPHVSIQDSTVSVDVSPLALAFNEKPEADALRDLNVQLSNALTYRLTVIASFFNSNPLPDDTLSMLGDPSLHLSEGVLTARLNFVN